MLKSPRQLLPILAILLGYVGINSIIFDGVMSGPDAESYLDFAASAQHWDYWTNPEAFLSTYFPVGYPFLLSLFGIGEERHILGFVLQLLLGIVVLISTWGLASSLGTRSRTAATLLVAFSPFMTWMTQNLGYEMACSAILVSAAFLTSRLRSERFRTLGMTLVISVLVGVLLGWALLMQSAMIAPVAVILIYSFTRLPLAGIAATGGALVMPLAWTVRNFLVLDRISPFSTNGPLVFWHGNNPETIAGAAQNELIPPPDGTKTLTQAALDFLLTQPERVASLYGRKVARLLEPNFVYIDGISQPLQTLIHNLSTLFSITLLILVAAYIFRLLWIREPSPASLTLSVWIVVSLFLFYVPFQAEPRYLTPIGPFAVIIAVACMKALRIAFPASALTKPRSQRAERTRASDIN